MSSLPDRATLTSLRHSHYHERVPISANVAGLIGAIERVEKGGRLSDDHRFALSRPAGKRPVRHRQSRIGGQPVLPPDQKAQQRSLNGQAPGPVFRLTS